MGIEEDIEAALKARDDRIKEIDRQIENLKRERSRLYYAGRPKRQPSPLKERIIQALSLGPLRTKDIVGSVFEEPQMSSAGPQVSRACSQMQEEGILIKSGGRWALTKGVTK